MAGPGITPDADFSLECATKEDRGFATDEDLASMRDELRRSMLVLYESLRDDIRLLAKHVVKWG